jgi:hypothetical protein
VAIETGGDEVEITHQDEGFLMGQPLLDEIVEPVHPAQLVGKFLAVDRVSVWQVDVAHADNTAVLGGKDAFDEARLRVLVIARKAAMDFIEREF